MLGMGTAAGMSVVGPEGNLLSLLVVDDERSIREACREIAEARGYEVSTAENAERAFRLLQEKRTTLSCWICVCRVQAGSRHWTG